MKLFNKIKKVAPFHKTNSSAHSYKYKVLLCIPTNNVKRNIFQLQVLQARLVQVENEKNNVENCLDSWMDRYGQKMEEVARER